jgi:hypothetical protein
LFADHMKFSPDLLIKLIKDYHLFKTDEEFFWSESMTRRLTEASERGRNNVRHRWVKSMKKINA